MSKIPIRHFSDKAQAASFRIRNLSDIVADNDLVQPLHRHDFFFLLAIASGNGEHLIDFTAYPVVGGSVFFMRPGQVHSLTLARGTKGFLMEFGSDFYTSNDASANHLLRKVSSKSHCELIPTKAEKLFSILAEILREYTHQEERHIQVIKANLEILLVELLRQSRNPDRDLSEHATYAQERLEELIELIRAKLHKKVSDYADMMHATPFQLNAITKATLGKTCSEVIDEHILLEAKRLLLATTGQVSEIADSLGYEDVSYFIRFFKKHTGYPPSLFRQNFT